MAEKRTINIDIKNNADKTAKDFDTLNKSIDNTTKSTKNLNSTFEEVYGELQPLTTRMGEAEDRLYELSLAGDTASKEYQELLTKVGEYRKVQIQTDLAVDGAATTMTQKLGGALTGATSGFAATQGAMALFGSENQALEESLLKVQSALAIQQGVQGLSVAYKELSIGTKIAAARQYIYTTAVGTSTGAMKLFRIAMISTGVGALVVGLGLLIANFDKVKKAVTNAISNFDKLGPAMKIILFPITSIVEGFKLMKKGLVAFGIIASDEENQAEKRAAASKKRFDEENVRIQKAKENLEKRAEQEKAFTQVYLGELALRRRKAIQNGEDVQAIDDEILQGKIAGIEKDKKAFLDGRKLEADRLDNLLTKFTKHSANYNWQKKYNADFRKRIANEEYDEVTAFNQQIENLRLDDVDKDNDALKTKNDNYRNYAAERLSIARKIEDIENSLLTDGVEKELEINRDKFRRLREDVKGNREERKILTDLYNQQEAQAEAKIIADNQKRREDAFETERSERVELLNFVDELNTKEVESEKAKNIAIIESSKAAAAKQKEIDEKAKADAQAIQDFKFDIASQGLQTISNLSELFAGKSEKAAKRAFQVQKAVSIAQATIDTYKSANAIFASTAANPITVLNPSAPFIAAGVAVAAGLVNVATIASQQFQGGGSNGGGGSESAPDLGGGAAPQFNVVGDSGINQIAQLQQQPVQAFVVSGEVTTSQALDRNRVQNATL